MITIKESVYDLMEFTQRELQARLIMGYTDDWQWNDRCFQFSVVWGFGPNAKASVYRFVPYEDEEFYGTVREQLVGWLDERF